MGVGQDGHTVFYVKLIVGFFAFGNVSSHVRVNRLCEGNMLLVDQRCRRDNPAFIAGSGRQSRNRTGLTPVCDVSDVPQSRGGISWTAALIFHREPHVHVRLPGLYRIGSDLRMCWHQVRLGSGRLVIGGSPRNLHRSGPHIVVIIQFEDLVLFVDHGAPVHRSELRVGIHTAPPVCRVHLQRGHIDAATNNFAIGMRIPANGERTGIRRSAIADADLDLDLSGVSGIRDSGQHITDEQVRQLLGHTDFPLGTDGHRLLDAALRVLRHQRIRARFAGLSRTRRGDALPVQRSGIGTVQIPVQIIAARFALYRLGVEIVDDR